MDTIDLRNKQFSAAQWDKVQLEAQRRGCTAKTKSAILEWVLSDYLNLAAMQRIDDQMLANQVVARQQTLLDQFEKRISSSLFRLLSEQAIETSILGQMMIKDIYGNLSESEIKERWNSMRGTAIEVFRETGKIMSWKEYLELAEDDESWQD